jgi:hypothetical protein
VCGLWTEGKEKEWEEGGKEVEEYFYVKRKGHCCGCSSVNYYDQHH